MAPNPAPETPARAAAPPQDAPSAPAGYPPAPPPLLLSSALLGEISDLTDAEMALWETALRARAGLSSASALADAEQINQRNRRIAYLHARGVAIQDIAAEVGLGDLRIKQLLSTPVMQELVAAFGADEIARAASVTSRLEEVAMQGVALISERMPSMGAEHLTKATLGLLDRAGHGPNKRVEMNVTRGLDRDMLAEIKSRARQLESEMLDVTPAGDEQHAEYGAAGPAEGRGSSEQCASAAAPLPTRPLAAAGSPAPPDPLVPLPPAPLHAPPSPATVRAFAPLPSADGGSALREASAPVAGGAPGAAGGDAALHRVDLVHGRPWPPGRVLP